MLILYLKSRNNERFNVQISNLFCLNRNGNLAITRLILFLKFHTDLTSPIKDITESLEYTSECARLGGEVLRSGSTTLTNRTRTIMTRLAHF